MITNKKFYIIILGIVISSIIYSIVSFSSSRQQASAQGWLSGFNYRVKIPVNSISGGETDYQMKVHIYKGVGTNTTEDGGKTVVIYLNNHAENWPYDVRFTKSDGTTTIPFWRERYDSDDGIWWVKLSEVPSSGTTDYYLYYGNSSVTDDTGGSNGVNTFVLFDDFSSDTTSQWNYTVHVEDNYHRTHHWVRSLGTSLAGARLRYKYKLNAINARNWASQTWIGLTSGDGNTSSYWGTIDESNTIRKVDCYNTDSNASETQPSNKFCSRTSSTETCTPSSYEKISGYSEGNYYIAELRFSPSGSVYDLWTDNYSSLREYTVTDNIPSSVDKQFFAGGPHNTGDSNIFEWVSGSPSYLHWKYSGSHYSSTDSYLDYYFYWMFVGKYASPEPTWASAGSEETSGPVNNPPNFPTLVSPANGSTISDDTPTLSAHYSDPDSGDTGVTHYRISSTSLSDCVNNINIVASGTSSETSTNDEDTTWTPSSSIGPDGTYYWCAQNDDGVDTSAWTEMGSFTLSSSAVCQDHNVYGWAWSERTGWISFSCENCDANRDGNWDGGECGTGSSIDYGVDIDPNTGEMSGYAWSERVGYISFNSSDLSGCPSGTCKAEVDLDTGEISGWAKAIDASGWDGWIKLSGTTQDGHSYGVSIDTSGSSPHEFSGWARSNDTIGWISFNCSNQSSCLSSDYKVLTDLDFGTQPSVSNPHETWAYCSDSLHPTLNWDYSDGDSGGYEVQIATDSGFSNVILDYTSDIDNSTSYHPSPGCPPFSNAECDLSYGNTYYWRVKAKNQDDVWSDWSDVDSFTTPDHKFPEPDFTRSPLEPKVGEITDFTDETTWGSGANKSWTWSIPDATYVEGTSASSQNPKVRFNSTGTKTVILQATDTSLSESGECGIGCCEAQEDVTVKSALKPHWHEIHPGE